ncbi:SH3 domain-containing protein [Bradyrhizobium canariense]|uniref:Uncharacterized conserved protein YraI n=1 Tax=Bradyrhizobium canariense TaxID=255045 RepID=A0A1H1R834_9BRAD|nr:SH3 domain-containing protein [Bradyrhizobium canariense]SDS31954.1 Uncharacterized conserved protein YraI [Bradyrhizobium canariense]
MKLKGILVAALLLTPTALLAAPGIVTTSVSMRAGPGTGFPMVDRIPGGAHVNVHGCIRGDAWCDVTWSDSRGWVSARYLEYLYRDRYVYLPDYVDVVDVPVVPFVLGTYWASYYSGRPWYHRRAYWNGYWQSHVRFAMRGPADQSRRFARTETRTAMTEGRTQNRMDRRMTRQQNFANVRGAEGRMAHINRAGRPLPGMHQPMTHAYQGARFSAAPMAGRSMPAIARGMPAHIAQPNVGGANMGRIGGSPMNARAQIGPPRAMGGMPHGSGAPHINAAPRIGGGMARGGGGGPGHQHR